MNICLYSFYYRSVATYKATQEKADEILKAQRANRPVSPHLEIYDFGMTMNLSALHRITGVALAFSFYGFTLSYVLLPLVGIPIDAASLATAFGGLPVAAKLLAKAAAASPFAFHFWNGWRHLIWDTTAFVSKKGVYQTGYTVIGLSLLSIIGLVLM